MKFLFGKEQVSADPKQALADQYNQLASTYQQCQSVKFHAELRAKQIANEMAEIKAQLDSLGAFGEKQ